MFPFFDPTFVLLIPALLLAFYAQHKVQSTYRRYSEVGARRGVGAEQVSRILLDRFGLGRIPVEEVPGNLTDHYDPQHKVLRLSESVWGNRSIAAIGVAAHEVGHAIQDLEGYEPLRIRNGLVPVVNIGSMASMPLFFLGFLFRSGWMLELGIFLFLGVVVFHLITLPVEFDASARALRLLSDTQILAPDELGGARAVLNAAALTYISATVMAVAQLLRMVLLRNMLGDRED